MRGKVSLLFFLIIGLCYADDADSEIIQNLDFFESMPSLEQGFTEEAEPEDVEDEK